MSKKKMSAEIYAEKRMQILRDYKHRLIKTGQEAQKMLNELEAEFRKKR